MNTELPEIFDSSKPCQCWTCQNLSPKVKSFEKTLMPEQLKEFRVLFGELFDKYENIELDYDVLLAKIEGSWPKEEGEKYYERVGDNLYEVRSNLVVEEKKCNHEFVEDGGSCKHCQCWTCQSLSPKVKQFREGLTPEQLKLFDTRFDELGDQIIDEFIQEQCSKDDEKQAVKDADEFIVGQLLSKL